MMIKSFRVFSTLLAFSLGMVLVAMLSFIGKSTRGPIENFFAYAGEFISNTEASIITQVREVKRADKLKWLQAYTANAALLKNPKTILVGAYDNNTRESFESVVGLEDTLRTTFPLIHIYTAWGSKPEHEFPARQVQSIIELGSIPVITWEPWLVAFDADKYPELKKPELRDKNGLADVAVGKYDFYIKKWAAEEKKIKTPVFLRMGHEMNDPYRYPWGPQNNSANDFIAAWKHVRQVFKNEGANNVVWVWSPHPAYGYFKEFYPGDSMVDYVGVSALNYGTVASWSKWWSFREIFGNYYPQLSVFNKPIMITEFGSLDVGGSRSQWFSAALDSLPQKYPLVKSLMFFHFSDDRTTTQQAINWYFINDTASVNSIRSYLAKWKSK